MVHGREVHACHVCDRVVEAGREVLVHHARDLEAEADLEIHGREDHVRRVRNRAVVAGHAGQVHHVRGRMEEAGHEVLDREVHVCRVHDLVVGLVGHGVRVFHDGA